MRFGELAVELVVIFLTAILVGWMGGAQLTPSIHPINPVISFSSITVFLFV